MNALAHHTLQLSRIPTTQKDEAMKLRDEARGMYVRLEEVDTDRKERYRDQGEYTYQLEQTVVECRLAKQC